VLHFSRIGSRVKVLQKPLFGGKITLFNFADPIAARMFSGGLPDYRCFVNRETRFRYEGHDVVEKSTRKIYNMPGLTAKLFCTFTKFFAETAIEQKWIIRLR
jgi:hypothetical protein